VNRDEKRDRREKERERERMGRRCIAGKRIERKEKRVRQTGNSRGSLKRSEQCVRNVKQRFPFGSERETERETKGL
jgi:hypothetical protein